MSERASDRPGDMAEGYFLDAATGAPTRPAVLTALLSTAGVEVAPRIVTRPVAGDAAMLTYVEWDGGSVAPVHAHAEEQLLLLLSGQVELELDGEVRRISPGDVAVTPTWSRHGGRGLAERSIAVESFAPPRAHRLELAGWQATK